MTQNQAEVDILKWYNKNKYVRIGSDVSVTELMKPVRLVHLTNRYRPATAITSLDNIIPSLTGSGLHDQLQRFLRDESRVSGSWMIERRMLHIEDGVRIAGRFDMLYNKESLYDIKVTRCWKYEKGDFSEWETQLNVYDYMLWKDGIELKDLTIMLVLLDWQQGKTYITGYPQQRVIFLKMKRWSRMEQEKYVQSKVAEWKVGLTLSDTKLPLCTEEQRWGGKSVYKLFRLPGHQKAYKLFDSKARAEAYMKACQKNDKSKWDKAFVKKHVANQWRRCENWCEVAPFCNQYQNKIEV